MLNSHFASCFSKSHTSSDFIHTSPKSSTPHLSSISCSSEEVTRLITSLKTKTASGPDGISSQMLKGVASSISNYLSSLFNLSLSLGTVPFDWKSSIITPVFKAGDPKLATNYRPISLLSIPSKLLERIVYSKLMVHLLENSLLSTRQFGFRPQSSTQEAILSATNDWHLHLDSKKEVACMFFDFSKAFDTLPHWTILSNLKRVGVTGSLLKWFNSYLSCRQQRVVLGGSSSSPIEAVSGVPQGSILGPLLFSLCMDPLTAVPLTANSRLILYADDILLYKPVTNHQDFCDLQSDINSISDWISSAGLQLNPKKTKFMVISRKRPPSQAPPLFVCGSSITQVHSFTYLGVTICSNLSWATHINNTCLKAKKQLGVIYRHFHPAGEGSIIQLYKSTVLPLLDYCSCVWDPYQTTYINMIEGVQKFAARLATKQWNTSYNDLLAQLGWPLLSTRRKQQKLFLCHRILSGYSIILPSSFTPHPSPTL